MKDTVAELGLVARLQSMDSALFGDLLAVKKFCKDVWGKSTLLPWFTDHGPDHSEEIIILLDQILKPLQSKTTFLNKHELFVLLASAYLHDIGMQFLKLEGISIEKLTEKEYNEVRKKHAELSSTIILKKVVPNLGRDDFHLPDINDEYIAPIALVCKAHSTEFFDEVIAQLKVDRYTPKGRPFRGKLLAALLLIADELDLQGKRINFKDTAKFDLSVHSQVHWYKHHYIDYVELTENVVKITLRYPSNSEEYRPLITKLIETKLVEQIKRVNPYLRKDTDDVLNLHGQIEFTELTDNSGVKRSLPPEVFIELKRVMGEISSPPSLVQKVTTPVIPIPVSTKLFTGMEQKKIEFRDLLETSNLLSVEGLGGVGKTEFVLKCIDEFLPKGKVVWFECLHDSKADSLIGFSGYPEVLMGENKTELAKYSGFIDLIERDEKTLILDNFQTVTGSSLEELFKFAEKRLKKAKIILLSREHPSSSVKFVPIELHGLGDDALLYAKKFKDAYYKTVEVSEGDLAKICTNLNGHPLAIELAVQLLSYGESSGDIIKTIVRAEDKSRELSDRLLDEIFNHPKSTEQEKLFLSRFSIFRADIDKEGLSSLFDEGDVNPILYKLIDKKMISVEHGSYRTHPLIREFCYQRLSSKEAVHEKAASYFETKRTDRFSPFLEEEIFYHLFNSGNRDRTARFISGNGEKFIHSGNTNSLSEMIKKMLAWGLDRPEYHVFLGDIDTLRGEWNRASRHFEDAFSFQKADDKITAEAYIKFGEILYRKGEVREALKYFQDAHDRCKKYGYKKEHARSANDIGLVFHTFGDMQEAKRWLGEGLGIRKDIGDREGIATSFNNIGLVFQGQGDLPDALGQHQESLKIQEEIGNKAGIARSFNQIGLVFIHQGDLSGALGQYQESLKINEEIGDRVGIASSLNNIGSVLHKQGDLSGALNKYQESLKIREEIGDREGISNSLNNIGMIFQNQGDLAGALRQYQESLKINEEIGDKISIAITLGNVGEIWRSGKNYPVALEYFLKSFSMQDQIGVDKSWTADAIHKIRKELGLRKFKEICISVHDSLAKDLQMHIQLEDFTENKTVARGTDKVGRNDPCPCGSKKKYKKCCGNREI